MAKDFLKELDILIRARHSLLYLVTWEEQRARNLLSQLAEHQGKKLYEWSLTDGLRTVHDPLGKHHHKGDTDREVLAVLNSILQSGDAAIYLLKDFHAYLDAPEIIRQVRDLGEALRSTRKTVIIVSPKVVIPQELEKSITLLDLPLPSNEELRNLLTGQLSGARSNRNFDVKLSEEGLNALVNAAHGLTWQEAENAFARAIVRDRMLGDGDVQAIMEEKRQIIRKSGLLEYYPAETSMNAVGGMDLLKEWLRKRNRAFSESARAYGLPVPRGVLLMGIQGCGKSLVAKTIAREWGMPLVRMDMSRIFQAYIGSSEENMRQALNMAETLAPTVLWIDEIEKAFSGMGASDASDSGTTARVIGQFLTWMQEKESAVFVVATANKVEGLPPELLRKGRLDEIFFVDLPRAKERAEIFDIHIRNYNRDPRQFDSKLMVQHAEGFSGAEIEQAIISALHDSYFENRELTTEDVIHNLQITVPLSQTMEKRVKALQEWAIPRARPVSSLQQLAQQGG